MATQADGTPGGICTAESSASRPPRFLPEIGTPITGRSLFEAAKPGSAADIPAPAMITFRPAHAGVGAVLAGLLGLAVGAQHADLVG